MELWICVDIYLPNGLESATTCCSQLLRNAEIGMSYRVGIVLTTLLCLTGGVNVVALVVNLSQPSIASVRDISYQDLLRDPSFTRAVRTIAEQCSVNVDIAKLKCQGG